MIDQKQISELSRIINENIIANTTGAILEIMRNWVKLQIIKNFGDEGRWDGSNTDILSGGSQRWKPLAPSTIRSYRKKGWSLSPTLNRSTNGLMKSIEVNVIKPYSIVAQAGGAKFPYARIHQEGGSIQKQVSVSAHKRKITQAFGRKINKEINIKSYSRNMNLTIPARPYLNINVNDIKELNQLLINGL